MGIETCCKDGGGCLGDGGDGHQKAWWEGERGKMVRGRWDVHVACKRGGKVRDGWGETGVLHVACCLHLGSVQASTHCYCMVAVCSESMVVPCYQNQTPPICRSCSAVVARPPHRLDGLGRPGPPSDTRRLARDWRFV